MFKAHRLVYLEGEEAGGGARVAAEHRQVEGALRRGVSHLHVQVERRHELRDRLHLHTSRVNNSLIPRATYTFVKKHLSASWFSCLENAWHATWPAAAAWWSADHPCALLLSAFAPAATNACGRSFPKPLNPMARVTWGARCGWFCR